MGWINHGERTIRWLFGRWWLGNHPTLHAVLNVSASVTIFAPWFGSYLIWLCFFRPTEKEGLTFSDRPERQALEQQALALVIGQQTLSDGFRDTPNPKSAAIMTEARRLALQAVKDKLKDHGMKLRDFEASTFRNLATQYLRTEQGQSLIEKAEANIARYRR
jgi:hypothetical protein